MRRSRGDGRDSAGLVSEFLTAPTGELFTLLRDHSVLVRERGRDLDLAVTPAFRRGLAEVERFSQAQLLHRLFECRGRSLNGELAPKDVAAFLSGLLIATDIAGALSLFASSPGMSLAMRGSTWNFVRSTAGILCWRASILVRSVSLTKPSLTRL